MRHFIEYGCKTVVLAFDDKRYVPKAKAITQLKRRSGVEIIDFGDFDALPSDMPQWKEAIMNPTFKQRVIELVCENIPRLVTPPRGCTLVIDWLDVKEYGYGEHDEPEIKTREFEGESKNVGEADIKFVRWMRALNCPMLIEATDGDYIPISLGIKLSMDTDIPISILKGRRDNQFEFVSINEIQKFLATNLRRASRGSDFGRGWEIKVFILLLGLSGTDFTRNLPLVSPAKMWDALPLVARTFDMDTATDINIAQCKRVIELLYAEALPKHIDAFSRRSVWKQAQV
jgi:hypothetical protein